MSRARAPKVCAEPGCPNDQPCPEHQRQPWAGSDRARRLPPNWERTRRRILKRDRNTCQVCFGARCGNRRLQVDHVVPGDDHRDSNLQTIGNDPCHREKSSSEGRAARTSGPA